MTTYRMLKMDFEAGKNRPGYGFIKFGRRGKAASPTNTHGKLCPSSWIDAGRGSSFWMMAFPNCELEKTPPSL